MKQRSFLLGCLVLTCPMAQAVLIDDFSISMPRVSQMGVGGSFFVQSPFDANFDSRDLTAWVDTTGDPGARATAKLGAGVGSFSTDAEVDGHFSLSYSNPPGMGKDYTANQALKLNFLYLDRQMSIKTYAESTKSGVGTKTGTETRNIAPSATPFSVTFQNFSTLIDWDSVTIFTFSMDPIQGGDFQLGSIEAIPAAVPEPSTFAAMGVGALLILRRRKS